MTMLAALLLTINPVELTASDRVDVAEVNHLYDEAGRHVFTQAIFYDWSPAFERHDVIAWRMLKGCDRPQRDWQRGGYRFIWQDGETVRAIQAGSYCETWTQFDPEIEQRSVLDKCRRRELRPPQGR